MEMGSVLEAVLAAPGMKDHRPAVVPRALGDSVRVVFQLRPGSSCVERGVLRGAQREVDREAVLDDLKAAPDTTGRVSGLLRRPGPVVVGALPAIA